LSYASILILEYNLKQISMKTIIPVFLVFATISLFLKTPNEEQPTSVLDELKTKSV
jgi:hypothetical protein